MRGFCRALHDAAGRLVGGRELGGLRDERRQRAGRAVRGEQREGDERERGSGAAEHRRLVESKRSARERGRPRPQRRQGAARRGVPVVQTQDGPGVPGARPPSGSGPAPRGTIALDAPARPDLRALRGRRGARGVRRDLGEIYRAYDTLLDRQVALKTLAVDERDPSPRPVAEARMLREARAAAALEHPNARSAIYDLGKVGATAPTSRWSSSPG